MHRLRVYLTIVIASASWQACNAAPHYNPVGVQNDVAVSTVLDGGWRVLYSSPYSEGLPSLPDLFDGACDHLMFAAKQKSASNFDVLATIEAEVFIPLSTTRDSTIHFNGAQWYKNDLSMGFVGAGDQIGQVSADANGLLERDRLSWHTMRVIDQKELRLNAGWRAGNNIKLNKSDIWERYVLTNIVTSQDGVTSGSPDCIPLG